MSEHDASARPSQVTVAGWTVAAASAVVVLAVWQTMTQLHGLDMRDRLNGFVTSGSGKELGLSVEDLIEAVRWSLYVTGVAAVASAILGVYVLRRDRAARIGVTVAAVPIVLTSPFAGSLPGLIVGAGAAMLWSAPARDWFAGRPVRQPAQRRQEPPRREDPAGPRPDLTAPPAALPPPTRAFGQAGPGLDFPPPDQPPVAPTQAPPPPLAWAPPRAQKTEQSTGQPAGRPARPARVPARVRIACWVTWGFTTLTGAAALAGIGVILANEDSLVDRVTASDAWNPASMDEGMIVPAAVTMAVIVALWCAGAAVLAAFAWRRQSWAWIMLLVSTAMALLFSVVAFPNSAVHLGASALCLGLLLNREIRTWYAGPTARDRVQPPRPW